MKLLNSTVVATALYWSSQLALGQDQAALQNEVNQLKKKVAELQGALEQKQQNGSMGMGMMHSGKGMGMHGSMKGENCKNPPCKNMGGMGHGMGMKGNGQGMQMGHGMSGMKGGMGHGMMGMKKMGGMGHGMMGMKGRGQGMNMPANNHANQQTQNKNHPSSEMPMKQHLMHIGSTDFFLDHQDHIKLSADQVSKIERIKKDYFAKAEKYKSNIQDEEAKLWELTSADSPNMKKIRKQVAEVEGEKVKERTEFISSVNNALKVLNSKQKSQLTAQHNMN